jgi:hypothetical protein
MYDLDSAASVPEEYQIWYCGVDDFRSADGKIKATSSEQVTKLIIDRRSTECSMLINYLPSSPTDIPTERQDWYAPIYFTRKPDGSVDTVFLQNWTAAHPEPQWLTPEEMDADAGPRGLGQAGSRLVALLNPLLGRAIARRYDKKTNSFHAPIPPAV